MSTELENTAVSNILRLFRELPADSQKEVLGVMEHMKGNIMDNPQIRLINLFNNDLLDVKLRLADIVNITGFLFCSLADLEVQNIEDYEKAYTLVNVIDRYAKDAYETIAKVIDIPLDNIVV